MAGCVRLRLFVGGCLMVAYRIEDVNKHSSGLTTVATDTSRLYIEMHSEDADCLATNFSIVRNTESDPLRDFDKWQHISKFLKTVPPAVYTNQEKNVL